MRRVKPDETVVCEVTRPIEWLGARPGDLLIAKPGRADAPLQLVREFDRSALVALPFDSLRELSRERQTPGPRLIR